MPPLYDVYGVADGQEHYPIIFIKLQLHSTILSAAETPLINEPSQEQKDRVKKLQKAEKARRRTDKDKRSAVKQQRNSRDWE